MQGILIGVVAAFVVLITIVGPEYVLFPSIPRAQSTDDIFFPRNHGSHFELAKTAIEEGGGRGELEDIDVTNIDNRSRPTSVHEDELPEKNSADLKV